MKKFSVDDLIIITTDCIYKDKIGRVRQVYNEATIQIQFGFGGDPRWFGPDDMRLLTDEEREAWDQAQNGDALDRKLTDEDMDAMHDAVDRFVQRSMRDAERDEREREEIPDDSDLYGYWSNSDFTGGPEPETR